MKIFNGLADSYDEVLDYCTLLQDRRWKDWVVRSAALPEAAKVLDVGCGTCVLEQRLRPSLSLVGIDLTEEMLRRAQAKRLPNVGSLLRSDAENLPFNDCSFDAVLSCYVAKYCDTRAFVSEAARVLKRGGRLVMYDFVRPRGHLWPMNAVYAYGGLRIAGKLLMMSHAKNSFTFKALPGVIAERPWEIGFGGLLKRHGFSEVTERLLPGGTAMGFCASRSAAR